MTEKIDIKQFDMANEKVSEPIALYVELHEQFLLYVGEYYCEVPAAEDAEDHSMGWKDQYAFFRIKIKKDRIMSVEMNWEAKRNIFKVELEAEGYPNSISFYFEREGEAEEMFKKLDYYIFGQ